MRLGQGRPFTTRGFCDDRADDERRPFHESEQRRMLRAENVKRLAEIKSNA